MSPREVSFWIKPYLGENSSLPKSTPQKIQESLPLVQNHDMCQEDVNLRENLFAGQNSKGARFRNMFSWNIFGKILPKMSPLEIFPPLPLFSGPNSEEI